MEPMESVEAIYNVHHGETDEMVETPVDAQSSGDTAVHMPDMEAMDQVQNAEISESSVDVHSLNADTIQMTDASIENTVGEVLVSVWTEPITWRQFRATTYKNIWNRNNMLMLEPLQHQNDANRVPVVYDEWDECKKIKKSEKFFVIYEYFLHHYFQRIRLVSTIKRIET